MRTTSITLALIFSLTACSEQAKDTHPQRWVSQRQAAFKDLARTLEPLGLMARDRSPYKAEAFAAGAREVQRLSARPWPMFPADSNYPPTKALASVWSQPTDFSRAKDAYLASVDQLVQAAQAGDKASAFAAVERVQQACKTCHDGHRK